MANFTGTTGNDTYAGTASDDTIHDGGGSGSDSLNGDAGSDVITLTGGNDITNGGSGADRMVVLYDSIASSGGITLNAPTGSLAAGYAGLVDGSGSTNVSFSGIEHFSIIYTGSGPCNVTTGDGNDSLASGSGADNLRSGGGIDTIDGGAGLDRWGGDKSAYADDIVIDLTAASSTYLGTGSVTNIEGFATLLTGSGDDQLTGTTANLNDTVSTGGGDDVVTLFGLGSDSVDGGAGSDRLVIAYPAGLSAVGLTTLTGDFASGYSGVFDGPSSTNVSFAGIESFSISMEGTGFLNITTGGGDDVLTGGGGNDSLRSGAGIDVIDGGDGLLDRWGADMSAAADGIVIDLTAPSSSFLGTGSVTNVEGFITLLTGSGDDRITGSEANISDTINTGEGNDEIALLGFGNDSVVGGAGSDRLSITWPADFGAITMTSISGDFTNGYNGVFDGPAGNNVTFTGIENFTLTMMGAHVLNVVTGDGADVVTGGDLNDILTSGGGIDVIDGGDGIDRWGANMSSATDAILIDLTAPISHFLGTGSVKNVEGFTTLSTGSGNDTIEGTTAATADTINTGDGDDVVTMSGTGSDRVDGGAGTDRLIVNSAVSGVSMSVSGSLAAGYAGVFDGPGGDNVSFAGNEHFSFDYSGTGAAAVATGDGDDVLMGGGGGDDFVAGGGSDLLDGRGGADSLNGGDGGDTIRAGLGADTVVGGLGSDRLVIDYSAATASIVSGAYTPTGGGGFSGSLANPTDSSNVIFSGIEAFEIHSGSAADTLIGADGDDTLDGGAGNDSLAGGAGQDTATYAALGGRIAASLITGVVSSTGGNGTDSLTAIENLIGTALNDLLTGNGQANALTGGDGADTIEGGDGDDTLAGGGGGDTASYAGALAGVTVALTAGAQDTGGAGTDVLSGFERLIGSDFADSLTGDGDANSLSGGAGGDTLVGGLGADTLNGGSGTDTASYADASTAVIVSLQTGSASGGDGSDTLIQIENLVGSAFDDLLTGSSGDNILQGGGGRDTLLGAAGNDLIDGGVGKNTASYAGAASGVTVKLSLTTAQDTGGGGTDTLINIADLLGSGQADFLYGNARDNRLTGGNGADFILGGGGDDRIDGGERNDTLGGGGGDDLINGGSGKNTATYAGASAGVEVNLALGEAQDTGGDGTDTLLRILNLEGSGFDDVLKGDERANTLAGGAGGDTLAGGDGRDNLEGGTGADKLIGGARVDRLDGGAHNDTLFGGAGIDVLTGGGGGDTFAFDVLEARSDRIVDLTNADVVDLHLLDADSTTGGNQAFELVSSFHHVAGEMRLIYKPDKDATFLDLDTDGDGHANMSITLDGDHTGFSSFVL
jgi:Ca2+-binding RTX toxin-like protein